MNYVLVPKDKLDDLCWHAQRCAVVADTFQQCADETTFHKTVDRMKALHPIPADDLIEAGKYMLKQVDEFNKMPDRDRHNFIFNRGVMNAALRAIEEAGK